MKEHDLTLKELLSDRKFLITFCRTYLPEVITARINWNSLDLYQLSGEFVQAYSPSNAEGDPEKQSRMADVLYLFEYDGKKPGMFLFHCEHQSRPERNLPLRIMNYISGALLDYMRVNETDVVPVLIPIVYYHGRISPYPYSLDVYDLFEDKELAIDHLIKPILIDLGQYTDDELLEKGYISPAAIAYKHVFDKNISEESVSYFTKALASLPDDPTRHIHNILVKYCYCNWDYDSDKFLDRVETEVPTMRGDIMTMEEQSIQKGREQGREQGMEKGMEKGMKEKSLEVAEKMLQKKTDKKFISEMTGLSLKEIEQIV